jgi:hypothetical protein
MINKNPYLVQRGRFYAPDYRNGYKPSDKRGIDRVVNLDYMGAAEYEWGAVPMSYERIVWADEYFIFSFKHEGKELLGLATQRIHVDYLNCWEDMARGKYFNTKMGHRVDRYFEGKTFTRLKQGCKKKTEEVPNYGYVDFWWDIRNDVMVFPPEFETTVREALQEMRDEGWKKPHRKKTLIEKIKDFFKRNKEK